jgi:hypothetical protein
LATYAATPRVVPGEAPYGARELQQDGRDEQQPEEDVQRQLLPYHRDRRTLRREQHEQHDGGRPGKPRVALGTPTEQALEPPALHGARMSRFELHRAYVSNAG